MRPRVAVRVEERDLAPLRRRVGTVSGRDGVQAEAD